MTTSLKNKIFFMIKAEKLPCCMMY